MADKRQGLSEQIHAFEIAKSNFKVEQVEKEYELNARLAQVALREEDALFYGSSWMTGKVVLDRQAHTGPRLVYRP